MSLDVYLHLPPDPNEAAEECPHCSQPMRAQPRRVFHRNITHNLNTMADRAGIYQVLWRPEECGITHAHQLVEPLARGFRALKDDPDRFKPFEPENGWGTYDGLVAFVRDYAIACKEYPEATVSVSR